MGLCGLYVDCMGFYVAVWVIGDIMGLHGVLWGCVGYRGHYVPQGRRHWTRFRTVIRLGLD